MTPQERHLNSLINPATPKLTRKLRSQWRSTGNIIDTTWVINAISNGSLTASQVELWRQDYAEFINSDVAAAWQTMQTGGADAVGSFWIGIDPDVLYDRRSAAFAKWIDQRSAALIVNMTNQQTRAVNNILKMVGVDGRLGVESTAKYIRAVVGLTDREAKAVVAMRAKLLADGATPAVAQRRSLRYAATLERKRSIRIARTELHTAYSESIFQVIRGEVTDGTISCTEKKWLTSEDERTCAICWPMQGQTKRLNENYVTENGTVVGLAPGAHVSCRCTQEFIVKDLR